jgi:hypothetical protein
MSRDPYQDLIWDLLRRFCADYTLVLRIDGAGFAQNSVEDSPAKSLAAQILRRLYAGFAYRRRKAYAEIRLKIHPQEI